MLYTSDAQSQKDFNITEPSGNVITSSRIRGNGEEWYLYNRDIRGSIESVTDDDEHLAAQYRYDPFGDTIVLMGEEFDNEYCYTGQIYDRGSDLYYCNARYYDPGAGRFTTQDSYRGEQTEPDTYHLYAYCANDPIDYVDPSGHSPMVLVGGVAMFSVPVGWLIVGCFVMGGTIYYLAEHKKNARKSTWNKHTKPRPGRSSEKKRQKSKWKSRSNKRRK